MFDFFCPLCFSGVDFQMKSLIVDGEPVLLQLWDTAGQERYVSEGGLWAWFLHSKLHFISRVDKACKRAAISSAPFRFRSIAKSYFRRADGVLLLYDVTCEKSFLNVREWVDMIEVMQHSPQLYSYCLTHFVLTHPDTRNLHSIVISISTATQEAFVVLKVTFI